MNLTDAELEREITLQSEVAAGFARQLIAMGRGHERAYETSLRADAFSIAAVACSRNLDYLLNERKKRLTKP